MSNKVADFYIVKDPENRLPRELHDAINSDDSSGVIVEAIKTGELYQIPNTNNEGLDFIPFNGTKALIPTTQEKTRNLFKLIPELASTALGGYFESSGKAELPNGQVGHFDLSTNRSSESDLLSYNLEVSDEEF